MKKIWLHCVPSPQVTAPGVTRLLWQVFLYSIRKNNEGEWVPGHLPCPDKRVTPHHWLKGAVPYPLPWNQGNRRGACSSALRKQGNRLQESTTLISASLKRRPSGASQALARQQTLTRIKNWQSWRKRTKEQKKKTKERSFPKWKYYGYTV